ncbi:hypothetical protein JCM5350_007150 [Sporobolomyces pararoseus]
MHAERPYEKLKISPGGPQVLRQVDSLIVSLKPWLEDGNDELFAGLSSRMLVVNKYQRTDLLGKDVSSVQHLGFHWTGPDQLRTIKELGLVLDDFRGTSSVPSQLRAVYLPLSLRVQPSDSL